MVQVGMQDWIIIFLSQHALGFHAGGFELDSGWA